MEKFLMDAITITEVNEIRGGGHDECSENIYPVEYEE